MKSMDSTELSQMIVWPLSHLMRRLDVSFFYLIDLVLNTIQCMSLSF
jgi:hypothetical protein